MSATERLIDKVVIIEDETIVALDMESILVAMGMHVRIIENGDPLPDLLSGFRPQLIILDIRLKDCDAFTILKSKIDRDYGGVISIVSGSGLEMMLDVILYGEKRGFKMGPPALKPFGAGDLQEIVDAAEHILVRERISIEARRLEMEQCPKPQLSLRVAISLDRLEIWYQPKFDIRSGNICGAEALVRGRSEDGKVLLPNSLFIGANQADILDLTEVVIRRCVERIGSLRAAGFSGRTSVNVPMSFLRDRDPAEFIRKAASQAGWPGMLFEITEDEALANSEDVRDVAAQLRLYGIDLSIDDFGTGYSSLARLRDLSFTELKLDRSFVHGCSSDSTKYAICKNVLSLGKELGCSTVAEGVECADDLAVLAELGCDIVQGFLFSRPIPFRDLLELIRTRTSDTIGFVS